MNKFYYLKLVEKDDIDFNVKSNKFTFNKIKNDFNTSTYYLMDIGNYKYSNYLNFLNKCDDTYDYYYNYKAVMIYLFKDIKFIYNYKRILNYFKKINQSITAKFMHPTLIKKYLKTGIDELQIYDYMDFIE